MSIELAGYVDNPSRPFKLARMNDLERYAEDLICDDGSALPPEVLLDKYHPRNDKYFQELNFLRKQLQSHKTLMKPKAAMAVALFRNGKNFREIGDNLMIGPNTISKYVQSPDGIRLRQLLDHQQQLIDGPNVEHRKGILYRIVVDNEKPDPAVAIQALKEINKMSGVYENTATGNVVNIQINADLLPRGALDVLPETFETRQKLLEDAD